MLNRILHKLGFHAAGCTCHDSGTGLHRSVFSILRGIPGKHFGASLCGTGFFVGDIDSPVGVTAAHVLDKSFLSEGEFFFVGHASLGEPIIVPISDPIISDKYDLACFKLPRMNSVHPIALYSGWGIPAHADILCYEYSATSKFQCHMGHDHLRLEHSIHKGHVVRYFQSEFPEKIPTWSILTSFPVLQGASGAPVLIAENYSLMGVVVANYEQHLMPAQVVSIADEKSETKYFLPYGKAISVGVVREFLEENGVKFYQKRIKLPSETPPYNNRVHWRQNRAAH